MSAIDRCMFGKDWWALPLAARCASVDALRAGIAVSVEMVKHFDYFKPYPCIVWHGTTDQFRATRIFPEGIVAKRASGRHVAVTWRFGSCAGLFIQMATVGSGL